MTTKNSMNWEQQFNSLKEYKSIHGNCDVPVKNETYKSLGRWVSAQRKKYQQQVSCNTVGAGNELEQRFQRLKDIGFNFVIGSGNAGKKQISITQSIESVPINSVDDKADGKLEHHSQSASV